MKLCDIYRASDVNRWQIVKTAKQQSVAEHSFNVAMIAQRLSGAILAGMGYTEDCIMWALWHDLPEVFTGDLATPLKTYITDQCGKDPLVKLEEDVCGGEYRRQHKYAVTAEPVVAAVVKLADLIEAIKFLSQNALTKHGKDIEVKLKGVFASKISEFNDKWPQHNWLLAEAALTEIFSDETHLDDLVR